MNPMQPGPEDFARQLASRRNEMEKARAIAYYAHSRTGMLRSFLHRLAERIDPTGQQRQAR